MLLLTAVLALLLRPAAAVFADEAYNIDYHYELIGEPQSSTTFFHRPNPDSRASLLYTLSEQGVAGALNPKDGKVVWRQVLTNDSRDATFFRAVDGADIVISGAGQEVAARNAADGKISWTYSANGKLQDLEILEHENSRDVIVLSDKAIVRLDETTGSPKWQYALDAVDQAYQVSVSTRTIYVVLLHSTMLGNIKIRVISLDPVTGKKEDEYTLSSENESLRGGSNTLTVGANTASPILAWTDASHSVLKVNVLGSKSISSFNIKGDNSVKNVEIHAPSHANSLSHFLVHYHGIGTNWADVFHIDLKSGKVEKAYSLPAIADVSTFSTSTIGANVYFTRISKSEIVTVSSASHGILGRWKVTSFGDHANPGCGSPQLAITEVSLKDTSVSAIRTAIWLSSGELVLLRDGTPVWSRPEILADTVKAEFSLPEGSKTSRPEVTKMGGNPITAFLTRVQGHISKYVKFAQSFQPSTILWLFDADASHTFGFDQSVICTTSKGWTYKLSATDGSILSISSPPVFPVSDMFKTVVGANIRYKLISSVKVEAQAVDSSSTLWTFNVREDERILSVTPRPAEDPVASIGVVLGNRNVLYKYLNPNLALISTAHSKKKSVTFYIFDTVSGGILYASTHDNVDLSMPITSSLSENWFAFSFTAESSASVSGGSFLPKGHFLVGGELYESLASNDRGPLDSSSNFSSLQANDKPYVLTQTYHISEPISRMAVTRTRQGITSKQLLVVLPDSEAVAGIPRSVLDPRRPHRDPTKEEQMEGLVKYQANLEFDPRWYLNHKREVLGIKDVITSPAALESTSLIFAFGLDVFGTRLSPSFNFDMLGKDFNKIQMLSTVAALFVLTVVVGPLVVRKQVNARWNIFT